MLAQEYLKLGLEEFETLLCTNQIPLDNVYFSDEDKDIVLLSATHINYIQHFKLLIKHVKSQWNEHRIHFVLMTAIEHSNVEAVSILLASGVNPNMYIRSGKAIKFPLFLSLEKQSLEIIKLLCAYGADVNIQNSIGQTPLMVSTNLSKGCPFFNYFLENGADVHICSTVGTAMKHAISGNSRYQVDRLLEHGASLYDIDNDVKGYNALHFSANLGFYELTKYFIEKGISVNSKTKKGMTPLLYVCAYGQVGIAKYLLSQGARIELETGDDFTCITNIMSYIDLPLLKTFMDCGLDIKRLSDKTTLFYIVKNVSVMDFLIANGYVDINKRCNFRKERYAAMYFTKTTEQLRLLEKYISDMEPELEEEFSTSRLSLLLSSKDT